MTQAESDSVIESPVTGPNAASEQGPLLGLTL